VAKDEELHYTAAIARRFRKFHVGTCNPRDRGAAAPQK